MQGLLAVTKTGGQEKPPRTSGVPLTAAYELVQKWTDSGRPPST